MIFIKPLITSVFLSSFIYFEYFNISYKLINTIFALFGFYLLFNSNKKELFLSGFFISMLWFWWISYSFVFYNLSYLIPLVIISIGTIYGLLFYGAGLVNSIYYKVIYIFGLTFIYPFGFNWLQLELPFINSYIGTSKIDFALILSAIILIIKLKNLQKYFAIIPLIFSLNYNTNIKNPSINIAFANTNISQNIKWKKENLDNIISLNFKLIDKAILNKKDLIILPETAFPMVLNKNLTILNKLKQQSHKISILAGSLYKKNNQYHNSTYLFQDGIISVAHKVVLIPFGEAVPLPELLRDFINNTFYDGAKDFKSAKIAKTFIIKGVNFRNAICYEATTNKIFNNLDTKYMIAISNNAWFSPSIQPTLQKLLFKYYENKYNVKIFSVTNKG